MSNENNQYQAPQQVPNPMQGDFQSAVNEALATEKKKKKKKKLIIFAVIAVIIIAIIALGAGGKDEGKKVEDISGSTTSAQTGDTTQAATEQKIEAGKTVTLDGLKISYVSCDANFTKLDQYSKPAKGNKVVRVEFKFENTSSSDISLSGFDCYADDKKCEMFLGSPDDSAYSTLESVSPGRSFTAVEYYEVPANANTIELEYEDELWGNEKTIFVVK